jgi:uncharacterized protein YceH (UPF0502 family)
MTTEVLTRDSAAAARWRPLAANERRVLGVLVEKAKTTPEGYPLTLNALRTGCNQKSNRAPQMQLEESQVEEALDELRGAGAVMLVQGDSRVDRYRHLAYEWLGVDKVELAVMTELLLRGAQTVGELRGRAARMEPIKDLGELQPILASLEAKRLIAYLTPPGRGALVTHTLFLERETDKLRREAAAGGSTFAAADEPTANLDKRIVEPAMAAPVPGGRPAVARSEAASLAEELRQLRDEVDLVKRELSAARATMESTAQGLRSELDDLNRQLGL